jgi:hypothetical protein
VDDAALVAAAIAGPDLKDTLTLTHPMWGGGLERLDTLAGVCIGVPRRTIADRADLSEVLPLFEDVLSRLSRAGARIVDPCEFPSAEQLQEVRSCVFRTEFKAALNDFLEAYDQPCGIGSLEALIAWNENRSDAIPYGQSLLIAANATAGLRDRTYLADRARDIALSRAAGIDAALEMAGADVLGADGVGGEMHRQGRRARGRAAGRPCLRWRAVRRDVICFAGRRPEALADCIRGRALDRRPANTQTLAAGWKMAGPSRGATKRSAQESKLHAFLGSGLAPSADSEMMSPRSNRSRATALVRCV